MSMEVNIYINVSHTGSLKYGTGSCCIILECITQSGPAVREIYKGITKTTENRTALIACIIALKHLTKQCFINLYINNRYVTEPINQDWIAAWDQPGKQIKNPELWEILMKEMKKHKVKIYFEEVNPYTIYMQTQLKHINLCYIEDRKEPYEFI